MIELLSANVSSLQQRSVEPTWQTCPKDSHNIFSCNIVFPNQICAKPKTLDEHAYHAIPEVKLQARYRLIRGY